MKSIIFLGGDRRMVYAAEVFKREYNCIICGFGGNDSSALNSEREYDYAVLPIQPTRDGKTIPSPLSPDAPTIGFDVLFIIELLPIADSFIVILNKHRLCQLIN